MISQKEGRSQRPLKEGAGLCKELVRNRTRVVIEVMTSPSRGISDDAMLYSCPKER